MGLFGQALFDLYYNNTIEPFYVCIGDEEHQLDLGFYLTAQPDSLEEDLLAFGTGKFLDIGCGVGRIIRFLTAQGYDVVGIDIDSKLVNLCREFTGQPIHLLSWEQMDVLGCFDTLLLCNRSLGIGGDIDGVKRLLKKFAVSAKPGGRLIFDSYEIKHKTGVLERMLQYKYCGKYSDPFPWIYISSDIAIQLLEQAGWRIEKVIREGDRYGVVARKD